MQPIIALYNPRTLTLEHDLTSWLSVTASYTASLMGGGSGYVDLEMKDKLKRQLPISAEQLFENSHYVRVGTEEELYPGVITSCELRNTGAILRVHFSLAMDYFENIEVIPFHRATVDSLTLAEDDSSNVLNLYGNNTVMILESLLYNNQLVMDKRDYDSSVIDYSDLSSYRQNTTNGFTRSFRINGFETKSLASCINEITGDYQMQLLRIGTNQNLSSKFSFIFEIVDELNVVTANFGGKNFKSSVAYDSMGKKTRSYAVAQGTDLQKRQKLERIAFNSNVAYSSLIADSAKEGTEAVKEEAQNEMEKVTYNSGTFTFDSYIDEYSLLDYLEVQGLESFIPNSLSGVVTEKKVEGMKVTYSVQVSPEITKNATFTKPVTGVRKMIYNPLHTTENLAKGTAKSGNKSFTTGWRQ